MSNPFRILKTVDQHLTLPAEITLFGRSALALGYSPTPAHDWCVACYSYCG